MSTYDKYNIKASEVIKSTGRQETRIDLSLNINSSVDSGSITGTVVDNTGNPIGNATVKLNTANIEPYDHTNTNPQGKFIFPNVPAGSYLMGAIKEGYLLPNAISVSVVKNKATNVTITLLPDPNANKNIIFGIVRSNLDNSPVYQAQVQLYQKQAEEDIFIGVAPTNEYGQYFFTDLNDGEYYAKASKLSYLTTETGIIDVSQKEYSSLDISLLSDPQSNTGVICGIIIDESTGQPVNSAVVALYSISGGVETLIKLTRSSVEGKYLFGNILPGDYRVKSTLQIEANSGNGN